MTWYIISITIHLETSINTGALSSFMAKPELRRGDTNPSATELPIEPELRRHQYKKHFLDPHGPNGPLRSLPWLSKLPQGLFFFGKKAPLG